MNNPLFKKYSNTSDEELVRLINNGDYELLGVIISRYRPLVMYYAEKFLPENYREDCVQEASMALYSAVKDYEPGKSSFSTFAGLCIKRSVINSSKSQNLKRSIPSELVYSIDEIELSDDNSPERIFFDRNDYKALEESIKLELSELEYKVLDLYLSDYSYSDISDKLSITEKSVSNALLRIRKKLKRQ